MKASVLAISALVLLGLSSAIAQQSPAPENRVLRGWLADEGCARVPAKGGAYTGTNPVCAKQCVAKGAKIVLILPDQKEILDIANQDAVKENIGNYVEVTGSPDKRKGTLHIDSVKMLEEGKAMCALPRKGKK